jgi:hypothetical protein
MSKQQNDTSQHNNATQHSVDDLPQPPPFQPKLRIAPLQLIGIPLLALLPLLALFGVFGESLTTKRATSLDVAVEVTYVARYRYGMNHSISVSVTKLSERSPATVTVAFDPAYIEHFSEVNFVPSAERLSRDGFVVELGAIESGETKFVMVEMQSEHYWAQNGVITVSPASGEPVTVTVSTMTFP